MPFNWTNITATNSWTEMASITNTYSGGILGIGILIITFTVAFTMLSAREGTKTGFIGASWITCLFCLALTLINLVPAIAMLVCFLAAGVSTVTTYFSDY